MHLIVQQEKLSNQQDVNLMIKIKIQVLDNFLTIKLPPFSGDLLIVRSKKLKIIF